MRPVCKLPVEATIVVDGAQVTIAPDYNPYRNAKGALQVNLGQYCSYCEAPEFLARDLHVEHVQPKGLQQYAHLETKWSNFLLACSTCNGADNKGDKDVVLGDIHLPHLNNTFLSLRYLPGGVVIVNPDLTGASLQHADKLWKLVGLEKLPTEYRETDTRWRRRGDVWNIASRYRKKYDSN